MAAGFGERDNESPVRIGSTVYCITCLDDKIQGEVMCFDETTRLMAIKSSSGNGKDRTCDVTFVNLNFAKTLRVLERPQPTKKEMKDLPALNLNKLKDREEENIMERKLRLERGIAEEGINLYRTIKKTLTCSWQDKSILVEGVLINPPYRLDNCRSSNSNLQGIEYVKKLVLKHLEDQQNGA